MISADAEIRRTHPPEAARTPHDFCRVEACVREYRQKSGPGQSYGLSWLAYFFACFLDRTAYAGSKVATQMSFHEVLQVYATMDAIRLLTTDIPLHNKSDSVFTPLYTPVQIYRVTVLPRVRYIYFPYAFARAENPWKL